MDPVSVSVLLAARWALGVLTVVLVLLMTYICGLRALLLLRERRYRTLSARWTPILLGGGRGKPELLPIVRPQERFQLLVLWNALREQNEQDAAICGWMDRVAALTKLDHLARHLLHGRSVRRKLLAIVTLGQLLDRLEWRRLCELARAEHPLLALAATQAIARIDPVAASETVVSLVVRHANWPAAKVASIFAEIGPERLAEPFARALLQAEASQWPRLIPFLAMCHYSAALPAVRQILREPHS